MSNTEQIRVMISERLSAAVTDIFGVVERTIAEYVEEVRYSKKENDRLRKLLTAVLKPEIKLHRSVPPDPQKFKSSKKEVPPEQQRFEQEKSPSLDQEEPEPPQIKEELLASQDGHTFQDLEMKGVASKDSTLTVKYVGSLFDEDQPQFSNLDTSVANPSTNQMKVEPDIQAPGVSDTEWTPSRDNPYNCHVSTRAFSVQSSLEYHMLSHTGAKIFNCKICRKRFKSISLLTAHMKNHKDERPFKCTICSKGFKRKDSLDFHMRSHTGESNYCCSFCGKILYSKYRLINHMRIHTGDKPFKCSICSRGFNNKSNVKSHMMAHTGERPYGCGVCGKGFKLKRSLKSHMAIHDEY